MNVLFLADFYHTELNGGAENNDAVLIDYLRSRQINVCCEETGKVTVEMVNQYDALIISNFVLLAPALKSHITASCSYIIYEHDHKYVRTRDPSKFANFCIPEDQIINREFYENAKKVVVLSSICKEVIEKNLKIDNVYNIGTSLWSKEKLKFIKELSKKTEKTKGMALMNSTNKTKGTVPALRFCQQKGLTPEVIESPNQYEFLTILSQYESLLFLPQVLETYSRLVAEAKMLNCKVMTQKTLIGFMSESYSDQTGISLIETIEGKVDSALDYFYEVITS